MITRLLVRSDGVNGRVQLIGLAVPLGVLTDREPYLPRIAVRCRCRFADRFRVAGTESGDDLEVGVFHVRQAVKRHVNLLFVQRGKHDREREPVVVSRHRIRPGAASHGLRRPPGVEPPVHLGHAQDHAEGSGSGDEDDDRRVGVDQANGSRYCG